MRTRGRSALSRGLVAVAAACIAVPALSTLTVTAAAAAPAVDAAQAAAAAPATAAGTVAPNAAADTSRPDPTSPEQRAALAERHSANRDATDQNARTHGYSASEAAADVRPANAPTGERTAASESLSVTKNFRNTTAQAVSSTLAEPSAANDSRDVVYGGNTYLSQSTNSGSTWTAESIPAGPSDAPSACCDLDAVHHPGLDTTFTTVLYTNSTQTNGVVRINVRNARTAGVDCSYDIDPGGTANNILPDYPHIAVGGTFLYLSMNLMTNGSTWAGARMMRITASQLAACTTASTRTFNQSTGSQRVWVPVEGATTTMFWGQLDDSTTLRIFSWPEATTSVSQTTRTVSASAFNNPDCRGGTGNFDFIERATAFSITGFRLRGATGGGQLSFFWPSSPNGSFTQAYVRGAQLSTSTLTVLSQPVIFNQGFCFGFPVIGANSDGELALSIAAGGKAGGGGTAAHGDVGVDDSSSSGVSFSPLTITATATHNRSDGRYGDYFTVRNNDRCAKTWTATNYGLLNGNTTSAHVNARYVELQSSTEPTCPT